MKALHFATLTVLIIAAFNATGQNKETRPNFIIFIADDVSWNDFACYGNPEVSTPNIDQLAAGGMRCTHTFLTASSCSPSRISILTGRYPHNTGAAELHTSPSRKWSTFASELKGAGYYTAQAGKWHMGELIREGFDLVHDKENGDGGESYWVSLVENRPQDKPFCMWMAAHDAHRVWGPNDFSGTHQAGKINPPPFLVDGDSTRKDLAKYYDEISRFDHHIGKVVEKLKEQGAYENTFIIVMADNGMPFPRAKTRVYDSGMRTPFVLHWPIGITKSGTVCGAMLSVIDIGPTLLDLAGIEKVPSFQGRSFAHLLNNPEESFRGYVFAEHNWHDYEAHERMVRSRDFMYILNSRPQFPNQGPADSNRSLSFEELKKQRDKGLLTPAQADVFLAPRPHEELFDCRSDKMQLVNIASLPDYQQKKAEMREILEWWMDSTGDSVPKELTPDWYDRETGASLGREVRVRGTMPGDDGNK